MKKILFIGFLSLYLIVSVTTGVWAGAMDDYEAAKVALNQGNNDEAIRLYTQSIDSGELPSEKLTIAYNNRGFAWRGKGDYTLAIADYTKAIKIDPNYAEAYFNLGYAWLRKGEYDLAIGDCTRAIAINSKYTLAYINRGVAWARKGEYDKAIADYDQAIRVDPDFADAYYNRGIAYEEKGNLAKAEADFKRAKELGLDP